MEFMETIVIVLVVVVVVIVGGWAWCCSSLKQRVTVLEDCCNDVKQRVTDLEANMNSLKPIIDHYRKFVPYIRDCVQAQCDPDPGGTDPDWPPPEVPDWP